jgi:hypothetical protein
MTRSLQQIEALGGRVYVFAETELGPYIYGRVPADGGPRELWQLTKSRGSEPLFSLWSPEGVGHGVPADRSEVSTPATA